MNITLGKISWLIAICLFIYMSYSENVIGRAFNIINDKTVVVEFGRSPTRETTSIDIIEDDESDTAPTPVNNPEVISRQSRDAELYIMIERMKWKMEQLDEKIVQLEVNLAELTNEKDEASGNLVALIGALTPLLLPVITSRFSIHKKEIKLRKS